MIGTCSIILLL